MFSRHFTDYVGHRWNQDRLIVESENLVIVQFDVNLISNYRRVEWSLKDIFDFMENYKRVLNADLTVPVILSSEGFPMDGWHCIVKAKLEDVPTLPARRFKTTPSPCIKSGSHKWNGRLTSGIDISGKVKYIDTLKL